MSNCVSVKAQLNAIMEALTNAAVAEINKLFEDSSAVLFLEISRSQRENQALRKKLQLIEGELRSAGAAENGDSVCGTQSLFQADEDWPADVEGGPSLIKVESCEEVWGGSDVHTQLDSRPERAGAGDLGCSHWVSSPAKAPPAEGAGELSEDDDWGGDAEDSHCSDTTEKDPESLTPPPQPLRSASAEGGVQHSLPPPTAAIKLETVVLPVWGEEAGPGIVHSEEAGPGVVHSEEAGLRIVFSERAGFGMGHDQAGAGAKPHRCRYCEKRFARPRDLRVHELTHTEQTSLSCAQCGKTFARRYYLRIHQRYHTGEKLLKCAQCDMTFACQHHLRQHQKCHSGEKPFSCATCGKDFSRKYNLKEHEKIHTGERPYACAACGKSFKQLSTLKTHQRSHNGETFSCVCGKSFNRKYVLKVHQRIHTGERPYGCEQCGKSFTQPCVLRSHMRTHCGGNRTTALHSTSVM